MIPRSRAESLAESLQHDPGGEQPLTDGQRALWFLQRLRPDVAAWNIAAAARVQGRLDPRRLREAFERLAARHEALRLSFHETAAGPVQRLRSGDAVDFREEDASCWTAVQIGEALQADADRSFDLSRDPLLRVRLLQTAVDDVLLLVVHHLVADLGSLAILVRELGPLYAGETSDPVSALQYAAYADGLEARLQGRTGERHWVYWRERLSGALPVLELPADRPRPPVRSFRGGLRIDRLSRDLTERLRRLGGERRATLFMVLTAGLDVLLNRASGETDLLVGSPTYGRLAPELHGTVGYFVNPVVLRSDLSGHPTFGELLERVRRTVLGALRHQEYPFARLVKRLQPEREQARSPIFQVMIALQRGRLPGTGDLAAFAMGVAGVEVCTGPLALTSLPLERRFSQFDLELTAAETDRGTELALAFNSDLFEPATAVRYLRHLVTLLAAATQDSGRRIGELPLLTEAERFQLAGWNETSCPLPERPVDELFEEQAALTPHATAVSAADGNLTYGELSARSNRVAQALAKAGLLPEEPVAVWTERGTFLPTALLGILKAGGVYFPLNPDHPAPRLRGMLTKSRARMILAADPVRCGALFPELKVIEIGAAGREQHLSQPLSRMVRSLEEAAYLLFTSGSAGEPKGALVTQRGLLNHLLSKVLGLSLTPSDRVAQTAPQSFDISIWQLLAPLLAGASVEVIPDSVVREPDRLLAEIDERGITVLQVVPSLLLPLVDEAERGAGGMALRRLITIGEALSPEVARRWLAARPGVPLVNCYGPTECADGVSDAYLDAVPDGLAHTSIGRPIANLRLYVVSPELEPQPIGFPGEVCIAGIGVGQGYLDDPCQTAAAFLPDLFGSEPGRRLYRTGDLGRRRVDGEVEILGRIDHQVKVRGVRVEPAEVEAALVSQPSVREAVVALHQGRLAAWWTGDPDAGSELRDYLRQLLPEIMIPASFQWLETLPLTPHGKLNRRALPDPAMPGGNPLPRDEMEQLVAGIFGVALGIEGVGPGDNFFALGGHSLLASQVSNRAGGVLGIEVPLGLLFEEPTVSGFAVRLRMQAGLPAPPPIRRAPRGEYTPLSFAQESLWLIHQLDPASPAYNVPAAVVISGRLDRAALARTLAEIVSRHEALRTIFPIIAGRPVQAICPPAPLALPEIDLGSLPERSKGAEAKRLARAESLRPFDLARGPLLRAALARLGEEHLFLLTMHHAISDEWSVAVLMREVGAIYPGLAAGHPSPLPPLPIQVADHALWQREWLRGEALEARLRWWKERLADAPPVIDLPLDRPRTVGRSFRGGRVALAIPTATLERLRRLARERSASLFMVLLAAVEAWLSRHGAGQDLVVGTPVANRSCSGTEGLIGFFVNTLPLRADLSGAPGFGELVERARETALSAFAHQDLPFERLVQELRPERSLTHTPLFQVMLALHNVPVPALELPGLSFRGLDVDPGTAKVDLLLDLSEGEAGWLEYAADLFDRTTSARLAAHLRILLEAAAQDPEQPFSTLPLLAPSERRQIAEWSAVRASFAPACLHRLFEAQVAERPEAVAVVDGRERLTYAELDRSANRLARHLRRLGVGPEARVVLRHARTPGLVGAILGILKAGAAYVPVDLAWPEERQRLLLEDAGATMVVDEELLAASLDESDASVTVPVSPESLAYVIYTSGSSGRPKGTMVTHANASRLFAATEALFGFGQDDVWTLFHSTAFDFSVWEIWGALAYGGRLVMVPDDVSRSPQELRNLLEAEGVTVLNLTPSAFRQLARLSPPASIRNLIFGGEALDAGCAADWIDEGPRMVNMYGITETTVHVTYRPLTLGDLRDSWRSPIGIALPDLSIHVLDHRGAPVPVGVPGELWVGGAGVARGYLKRPDLTAERFLPDPFSGLPGNRLYRSGDLARWLASGELEYLGRIDQQVKLRGFRVEPGEVEAALREVDGVAEAAVVLRNDLPAGPGLVAYVVGEDGNFLTAGDLLAALRSRLPVPMVPGHFVFLQALPLTGNGKLDRRALPAPEGSRPGLACAYVAPHTPLEQVVAGIWEEALGVDRVGVEDGFFDLGGHSLLGARLISRLNQAFGTDLLLRDLFEAPTVAGLTRLVSQGRQGRLAMPELRKASRGEPFPVSFAQERLWVMDRLLEDRPVYNVFQPLDLSGPLDEAGLEAAFGEVVRRHEALRTRFITVEGVPMQVVSGDRPQRLPRVDLRALSPAARQSEADRLTQREARRPFDLEHGPLLRVTLLRLGEAERRLLLTLHHIVCDGWSGNLLVYEVGAIYRGQRPPELPFQYVDYAEWQRYLPAELLDAQLAWWVDKLAGLANLELPTDRPRPAAQTFLGDTIVGALPQNLTARLRELARERQVTPFMLALAAWQVFLHRITGETDVVVGSPAANRSRPEVEDLIGFFVNNLVLRADLSDDPTFDKALATMRETALFAYAHQDLPFERLVNKLAPERDLSRSPLFQVAFSFQKAMPSPDLSPDLCAELLDVHTGTTKLDLSLLVEQESEGWSARVEYATDLFDAVTIQRWLGHLGILLEGIATSPERIISDLPLLSEAECEQLQNRAGEPLPARQICVHRLFEEWARAAPAAPALLVDTATISYTELDVRVNRLARHLLALGIGPERVAAACLERSAELSTAMLAVLKAGGVWLPLDPSYPSGRMREILEDAGAVVVISTEELASRFEAAVTHVLLDRDAAVIASCSPEPLPEVELEPQSLAYIIYTSGSTGWPKGVGVSHEGLAAHLDAVRREYGLGPGDRTLQFASPGFDVSVEQVLITLTSGAALVVQDAWRWHPHELTQRIPELGLTFVNLPTAYWNRWSADPGEVESIAPLRLVLTGGEPMPAASVRSWMSSPLAAIRLLNGYGPTEAVVTSTLHKVRRQDGESEAVSIGKPIPGRSCWVVDRFGTLQPLGVPGELLLGGPLSRGYLGSPELTAEHFIPDPFSGQAGARLYRTGDRTCWLPGGDLQFLGRTDQQVKIRGFRVELEEIAEALRRCPAVREAFVALRENRPGDERLTAWYVPEPEQESSAGQLQAWLRERLPEFMVPSSWMRLNALPLAPSGKIDHRALATPPLDPVQDDKAPRTPLQTLVAGVFSEVLGVSEVPLHVRFFDLGGNSLMATQVVTILQDVLPIQLDLRKVMEGPTVARLAAALEEETAALPDKERKATAEILAELEITVSPSAA